MLPDLSTNLPRKFVPDAVRNWSEQVSSLEAAHAEHKRRIEATSAKLDRIGLSIVEGRG
jgi:hypothetical protein